MGKETRADSVIERFKAARLYAITTAPVGTTYERMVQDACRGGADIVQFRDKILSHKQRYELARRLRAICANHGVLFIVNDHLEVALAAGADGVHLGQDDLSTLVARSILQQMGVKNFLLGRSTHSLEQALAAEREGVDYIAIGPVNATPTKPTYQPVGLELVRAITAGVRTPHVAIGGIDVTNVAAVLAAGAERVAVVRAVCGAADIQAAARQLKDLLSRHSRESGNPETLARTGSPLSRG
jgi:thiamine-phosphate pyrophosphorylase